jgi:DNA-binding NarL/FixJ family response regulator
MTTTATNRVHPPPPLRAANRLTPRQNEILAKLGQGLSREEVAQTIGVSYHTIDFHIRCILSRIGAKTLVQAVWILARN